MGQFGSKKSPKELLRENKRLIRQATRELDRERATLEQQEKKLVNDIKQLAKKNQMGSVKIMAKDLVRTRRYISKFYQMRSQLQAVGLKLQTAKSTEAMTAAMKGVTRAMIGMSRQMNVPAMQRIMREFAMSAERMEMTEEMMSDAVDDVMEGDEDEEEEEAIVNQVLDEIGISTTDTLPSAPGQATATTAGVAAGEQKQAAVAAPAGGGGGSGDPALDELEARLNNLRK
mmetsp:Transcript_4305/g.13937  ORF Transcript_4305/g.13937 Transcript_4305/m.13937 type:complete len:230 (-) Transcript_4305:562-1251(-)